MKHHAAHGTILINFGSEKRSYIFYIAGAYGNLGVGLQIGPRHYCVVCIGLINGPPDNRGVGLQVYMTEYDHGHDGPI